MTQFSHVGNFVHALGCLQNWQPVVGNIGITGAIGSTNGRTLDGIGMPMAPLVESRTHTLSKKKLGHTLSTAQNADTEITPPRLPSKRTIP